MGTLKIAEEACLRMPMMKHPLASSPQQTNERLCPHASPPRPAPSPAPRLQLRVILVRERRKPAQAVLFSKRVLRVLRLHKHVPQRDARRGTRARQAGRKQRSKLPGTTDAQEPPCAPQDRPASDSVQSDSGLMT